MNNYQINTDEVLRYLGYVNGSEQAGDSVCSEIDNMVEKCHRELTPAYTYRIYDISRMNFCGASIAAHLKGAKKFACMAVTLGMANEREIGRLQIISMKTAVIYDAVSGALVESAADACETEIAGEAAKLKMYINDRFSPGYGDFPMEQQRLLAELTDCERILGMKLTESMMMIPTKSITAVLGLF